MAQLIEAATDRHLWSQAYERELREILALQSEVARAIAQETRVKLTPQEGTQFASTRPVNPEAHKAYLKGRYCWNKRTEEDSKKALDYFQEAVSITPDFGTAYAGLADCYIALAFYGGLAPKEGYLKAKAAALKALEIDDNLAEAHCFLAEVTSNLDLEWLASEREYQRSIERNPSYATAHQWYSEHLAAQGRLAEAIAEKEIARELDPTCQAGTGHSVEQDTAQRGVLLDIHLSRPG